MTKPTKRKAADATGALLVKVREQMDALQTKMVAAVAVDLHRVTRSCSESAFAQAVQELTDSTHADPVPVNEPPTPKQQAARDKLTEILRKGYKVPWRELRLPLANSLDRLAVAADGANLDGACADRLALRLRASPSQRLDIEDADLLEAVAVLVTRMERARRKTKCANPKRDAIDRSTIDALRREQREVKFNDLHELVAKHIDESAYRKRLDKLTEQGAIRRNGRGLYWHPQFDESAQ